MNREDGARLGPSSTGTEMQSTGDGAERLMRASMAAGPRLILWDLVGSCNLRCPSCPVGNMPAHHQRGLITQETFEKILAKLSREFPKAQLHFYNWTEPLIHPRIAEMCKAAADAGFHLHLSSNLNHLKDEAALLAAGCKTIRISVSGFTQRVYEIGHRGGNIERVKVNMQRLANAKRQTASRTRIHVYFHKYRHNLHELPLMEVVARELGFDFMADWAYLMPLEKLLDYVGVGAKDEDHRFVRDSIVPDPRDLIELFHPWRHESCELIDQLVIDHRGNAALCCATYDRPSKVIGSYLEMSWPDLQRKRYAHSLCSTCMKHAAHVAFTYFCKPELKAMVEKLAQRQLAEHRPVQKSLQLPVLTNAQLAKSA